MRRVLAAFHRPELSNVILIGEAGSGKTALMQGIRQMDASRIYRELDISKMIAAFDTNSFAANLKLLFDEIEQYRTQRGKELVLFIDEFHQIVHIAPSAVEVLKPLLADSGTRGIRVVAATTYIEFREFISPNQPLVERLMRINLSQPNKALTINILRDMAERYGVLDQFPDDSMFELIYEYTNRYIPANSQPRKSILILDSMVGWHKMDNRPINMKLLADVIYESEGVNVAFRVDASKIKSTLDENVLAQTFATTAIEQRLQICVADLNNKSKPMSSFLFTGSTGVGKDIANYEKVPIWTDSGVAFKNHGELQPGDIVFDRKGEKTEVLGVFPHKEIKMCRITLEDGRTIDACEDHLWNVQFRKHSDSLMQADTVSTKVMLKNLKRCTYLLPASGAVEWPERDVKLHPYVIGAMLSGRSNGSEKVGKIVKQFYPSVCEPAETRRIPDDYLYGSINQRWALLRGIFDADEVMIENFLENASYHTINKGFAEDIQQVLFSLGLSAEIYNYPRQNGMKTHINYAVQVHGKRSHIQVVKIERIGKQDAQCILVDNDEHLYQVGSFIVTHNTEMTKQLAKILFEDERHLIRFDMTEFANPDSLNRFRTELTARVWERPYSVILLDEIEKACAPVTRLLLQVLDDGRLTDANDREVSFCNAYIILTTNAGSEIYQTIAQYGASDVGSAEIVKKYDKLIRESIISTTGDNKFPPELLGRIDTMVPFQPLSENTMKRIVRKKIMNLIEDVKKKHGISLRVDKKVIRYLVEDNLDTDANSGGARAVISKLESEVTTEVARFINANPDVRTVFVDVAGAMAADHKTKLESEAYIRVSDTGQI